MLREATQFILDRGRMRRPPHRVIRIDFDIGVVKPWKGVS